MRVRYLMVATDSTEATWARTAAVWLVTTACTPSSQAVTSAETDSDESSTKDLSSEGLKSRTIGDRYFSTGDCFV